MASEFANQLHRGKQNLGKILEPLQIQNTAYLKQSVQQQKMFMASPHNETSSYFFT